VLLGVDLTRRGLRCRLPSDQGRCAEAFIPAEDTVAGISDAGAERDAHELRAHGYVHVALGDFRGDYTGPLSKAGRSTLGKRVVFWDRL
jgi:hypothetical protein